MGGDVEASLTQTALKGSGPSSVADLARMGGGIVGPEIAGIPVLTATEDAAYTGFTVTTKGGAAPLVYALVGTWPAGISINTSTGAVTGTADRRGLLHRPVRQGHQDADSEEDQLPTFTLVVAAA